MVKGASLASTAVGKSSYFTLSNVSGNVEEVEVNVDGECGDVTGTWGACGMSGMCGDVLRT